MELYGERDRGRGYRFKRESRTLHFWKMARVCVSGRPAFCHMYLESKWVLSEILVIKFSVYSSQTKLSLTQRDSCFSLSVSVYRPHARGPRTVLWLHPVCSGVEWAGLHPETSAAPHRHTLQAGPEVGTPYLSAVIICSCHIWPLGQKNVILSAKSGQANVLWSGKCLKYGRNHGNRLRSSRTRSQGALFSHV